MTGLVRRTFCYRPRPSVAVSAAPQWACCPKDIYMLRLAVGGDPEIARINHVVSVFR